MLYTITDRKLTGLSHTAQVRELIAGGAQIIQLRDKNATSREFFEDAREALSLTRGANVKLIINDRVDLAMALGADGVHLGQDDLPVAEARHILGPTAIIGVSTHSVEQARDALSSTVDYVAIGPVFATQTKENPDPVVGLDGVTAVRQVIGETTLVAIGGITAATYHAVLDAGANYCAVISAVLVPAERITDNCRQFIQNTTR